MSPSMRRAVSDVNRQLSTIDKNALAAAASIGGKISDAAKTAAKAIAGIGVATATAAAGLFVKGGNDYIRTMNNIAAQTGVTGKELEHLLDEGHITANKNSIPNDDASPFNPNGLRIGTPAATTRGMDEAAMKVIGECIVDIIRNKEAALESVKARIAELTARYPLYKNDFILG